MDDSANVGRIAASLAESGEEFVLITVVKTQGSTPRECGARMIWRPGHVRRIADKHADSLPNGAIGTIGGGQFERLVLEDAEECLRSARSSLRRYVLGADADQCCGGVVEVAFEPNGRCGVEADRGRASGHAPTRARLVVFGAGHVSHELAGMLAGLPLDLAVVDDRSAWNSAQRFPGAQRLDAWAEGVALARSRPDASLAAVMTYSHDTDFELLRALLAPPADERAPPAFLGLIGSRSKRACMFTRLVALGADESLVQRIHCPIGVGDTGKSPREVAISIAAQVLIHAGAMVHA